MSSLQLHAPTLLLSLAPFAWFYAGNLHEPIQPSDLAIYSLATSAIALALAISLEALLPSKPGRATCGLAVAVLFFFNYSGISSAGIEMGGSPNTAAVLYATIALAAIVVAIALGSRPGFQKFLLLFAAANFVIPLIFIATDRATAGPARVRSPIEHGLVGNDVWSGSLQRTPNVYWIVVDSYPNARELLDIYAFDNSLFVNALNRRGFTVTPGSYANFSTTLLSVPSTLEMDYVFDQEDPFYETQRSRSWRRLPGRTRSGVNASIGGDNRSVSFFKAVGYTYIHYEGGVFLITRCQGAEDLCLKGGSTGQSDLESRLIALTPGPWLLSHSTAMRRALHPHEGIGSGTGIPELQANIEEGPFAEPFFLYAHIASPHRPYTNDALCNLLPVEFDRSGNRHFLAQLQCVNRQVEALLDSIVGRDPDAIVILSADHGPRLSVRKGTSLYDHSNRQVRESLSILQAFRGPPECLASLTPDLTPINSLRWVFACLGDEPPRWIPEHHFIARPDAPERGRIRRVRLE